MKVKIFADAGSNLFDDFLKNNNYDITIIPMNLQINDQNYKCYSDVDENFSNTYYDLVSKNAEIKTSLPSPGVFNEYFKKEVEQGNKIICFTMSSKISGTFQSANLSANIINEEYHNEMIHVIDTKTAGYGEGLQAIEAFKLTQTDKTFEELIKLSEENVNKIRSEFTVGHIKYLVKTGRVSALLAKIADVLNIKVILKGSNDGQIVECGKCHGNIMALKKLALTCVNKISDKNQTVYISHCNNSTDALFLKNLLIKQGIKNIVVSVYDFITGSHVGPGTIALFYSGFNRD